MIYYINLDVYFCLNFLMDFFLLLIVHRWNHCRKKIRHCIFAALIGTVYSIAAVFVLKNKIVVWICTYLIAGQLMIFISMDYEGIKKQLTYTMEFYFELFLCCGIIEAIFNRPVQNSINGFGGRIRTGDCLLIALGMYIAFRMFLRRMRYHLKVQSKITDVEIMVGNRTIKTKGLCDSGNLLTEPISGKPVCVIDDELMKSLKNQELKPVIIPYDSIDNKHGMMKGFWTDRIIVSQHIYYKIPVAVHHGNLSKNNAYKVILPPEIYNQRGKSDVFRKIRETKVTNENAGFFGEIRETKNAKDKTDVCRNHSSD